METLPKLAALLSCVPACLCRLQRNFLDWGKTGSVNNLAGSVALFCLVALWATSLNFVRRRFYEARPLTCNGLQGWTVKSCSHCVQRAPAMRAPVQVCPVLSSQAPAAPPH